MIETLKKKNVLFKITRGLHTCAGIGCVLSHWIPRGLDPGADDACHFFDVNKAPPDQRSIELFFSLAIVSIIVQKNRTSGVWIQLIFWASENPDQNKSPKMQGMSLASIKKNPAVSENFGGIVVRWKKSKFALLRMLRHDGGFSLSDDGIVANGWFFLVYFPAYPTVRVRWFGCRCCRFLHGASGHP